MAVRESNREQEIEMAAEAVCRAILMLRDGEETSIAGLVGAWYRARGYIFQYVGTEHGYVWTRDGGATFAMEDMDQMDVFAAVTRALEGRRRLDFDRYEGKLAGLPFNLLFVVRVTEA